MSKPAEALHKYMLLAGVYVEMSNEQLAAELLKLGDKMILTDGVHLISSTMDMDELNAFAQSIGLKRAWLQ